MNVAGRCSEAASGGRRRYGPRTIRIATHRPSDVATTNDPAYWTDLVGQERAGLLVV